MLTVLRWLVVAVLTGHGLIHLLGVAKGFGLADVSQLTRAVGAAGGVLWLVAGALVLTTAVLLAVGAPTRWWALALVAALVSQVAIVTSWHDARAGTVVNLVLVLAAGFAFATDGPPGFHAEYQDRTGRALVRVDASPPVLEESDLADLPAPLAAYVRRSGAVGKPRVVSFRAAFHGRIRSATDAAWMPFTGQQVSTYGDGPRRIFLMDATRAGLPVTVLHVFADATATMRVRLLSLFTVVNASGPVMDRGETVTLFNDLVVMAPGAIVGAPVTWTPIDDRHVRGDFTEGDETVSAVLTFDSDHDLVDFASDDRSRASADGRTFTREPWSTPLVGHRVLGGHRLFSLGEGVWNAGGSGAPFTYLELRLDAIAYNVGGADAPATARPPAAEPASSRRSPS